jgi:glycosyltransferase involved in cell wall biosynthesis
MNKSTIVVITGKWSLENKGIAQTASKLLKILDGLDFNIVYISNHNIKVQNNDRILGYKILSKDIVNSPIKASFDFFIYQIKVSVQMLKILKHKNVNKFVFCFGADMFFLPLLIARFFGKQVIIRSDGKSSLAESVYGKSKIKMVLFKIVETISYMLANKIVLESKNLLSFNNFKKYNHKIEIGSLYVDVNLFKHTKDIENREYDIGYLGRFTADKGLPEFLNSLSMLPLNIKTVMVGDGYLKEDIQSKSRSAKIDLIGWQTKEQLPLFYNNVKIYILPSYKEGLPNAVLEAMACGTPVLATPVGGIPDLITDGITGFIMANNSPNCIAENVIRVLNNPDMKTIGENGQKLIEKEYTYDVVLEIYKIILS